jgi:hypothetical protein
MERIVWRRLASHVILKLGDEILNDSCDWVPVDSVFVGISYVSNSVVRRKVVPKNYRLLNVGEQMLPTDEYAKYSDHWEWIVLRAYPGKVLASMSPVRREMI